MGKILCRTIRGASEITINTKIRELKNSRILKNLSFLKIIQNTDEVHFLNDYGLILATLHAIQENVQVCIDIAFHICASNKFSTPETYKNAFSILAENEIISSDLAAKLEGWASLRNLITHIYEKIDYSRIYKIIKMDLQDFNSFLQEISKLKGV